MADTLSADDKRDLSLVLRCFRHSSKKHEDRQSKYIARYRAFRGVLEKAEDQWQSQLSPPYIFQIIETIYSMIASEHPRDEVLPIGEKDMAGAEALNNLLPQQRRNDSFDSKYGMWAKQALVLGVSPGKVGWTSQMRTMKRREFDEMTGQMRTVEQERLIKDQPSFTHMDASDFFWDTSASRMDECRYAIARWWVTLDSLKSQSVGENPTYKNLDQLKDAPRGYGGSSAMKDEYILRDKENLIEVLEYWDQDRLICIANKSVVIRSEPNPLWHGKLPFVMATPVPDLYSMEGISEVELIMDIQAAIWTFLNQRLDNVRLISNAIVMIRDTMDDPEKLIFEPGAIWPVSDPQEVQLWTPNQNITEASLAAEEELKSDLLNLTAAMQYLGGSAPDQMDNSTATGISIMSNNAMNRVLTKRQRIYDALTDKGYMEIALNQQLMRNPVDIRLPGMTQDVPYRFAKVQPQDILCDCDYTIEAATESMNRQERRQEALLLLQTLTPLIPLAPQMGMMLNMQPMIEKVLDSFDVKNAEAWITPMPQPGMVDPNAAAGPDAGGAGDPAAGTPPQGGPAPGLEQLVPGLAQRLQQRPAA